MLNTKFELEYKRAVNFLKEAIKNYMPFLNNNKEWLTKEEIKASEELNYAEKNWYEARKKYFGDIN
jgi:hypothetical protein